MDWCYRLYESSKADFKQLDFFIKPLEVKVFEGFVDITPCHKRVLTIMVWHQKRLLQILSCVNKTRWSWNKKKKGKVVFLAINSYEMRVSYYQLPFQWASWRVPEATSLARFITFLSLYWCWLPCTPGIANYFAASGMGITKCLEAYWKALQSINLNFNLVLPETRLKKRAVPNIFEMAHWERLYLLWGLSYGSYNLAYLEHFFYSWVPTSSSWLGIQP